MKHGGGKGVLTPSLLSGQVSEPGGDSSGKGISELWLAGGSGERSGQNTAGGGKVDLGQGIY